MDLANATGSPSESSHLYVYNRRLAHAEVIVLGVMFCLALVGNAVALYKLINRGKKLLRMQILIVHLCIADIFVAFFHILPQFIWDVTFYFHGSDGLCRFVKYMQVVGMFAPSYVLVTTGIDRYIAICWPLTRYTHGDTKVYGMLAVAWILSAVFATPQIVLFRLTSSTEPDMYQCSDFFREPWSLPLYITWTFLAIYVIPTLLLVIMYARICLAIWKSSQFHGSNSRGCHTSMSRSSVEYVPPTINNDMDTITAQRLNAAVVLFNNGNSTLSNQLLGVESSSGIQRPIASIDRIRETKIRTVKLALTVVLCYFVCWSPFFIAQMWTAWDPDAPFEGPAVVIILLLASLNSCANPWIYMIFNNMICSNKPSIQARVNCPIRMSTRESTVLQSSVKCTGRN